MEAAFQLLTVFVAATVLFVCCYMLVRVAYKAAEVYRAARDYFFPPPTAFRVIWDSPAGSPPLDIRWRPWGKQSFCAMVVAADADAAVAEVEAAYERARRTGYPASYAPVFRVCKPVLSPLGGE